MGLKINGIDIENQFGVYVLGRGTYGAPEKDLELIHVPGRSGDVAIDHGCYHNISVVYPDCWILDDFPGNSAGLRELLMSHTDYVKISDPYHEGEYRMGIYKGPFEPEPVSGLANGAGKFDLAFSCKPQRWLDSGDVNQVLIESTSSGSASASITNPTKFWAIPDVEFVFTADSGATVQLTINGRTTMIRGFTSTVKETYRYRADTGIVSSTYSLNISTTMPELRPGSNSISVSGASSIDHLYLKPHWFTL